MMFFHLEEIRYFPSCTYSKVVKILGPVSYYTKYYILIHVPLASVTQCEFV